MAKQHLTRAEKQRRYILSVDNILKERDSEEVKARERRRWQRRRVAGKVKVIGDMTSREQHLQRRKWKRANDKRAEMRRRAEVAAEETSSGYNETSQNLLHTPDSNRDIRTVSGQKVRGHKLKRKDRSAAYRKINMLENHVLQLKRRSDKFRKQASRARELLAKEIQDENRNAEQDIEETPRKKARKMSDEPKVRKVLKFHYSLVAHLRQRIVEVRNKKESSQVLAKLFCKSAILKKYRTLAAAKRSFGLSRE